MTKAQRETQQKACERLRELIKPGDTVYTILRHRARSGMFRVIAPVIITNDGDPLFPTHLVAEAIGARVHREHEGISVGGCGMDMGYHIVHNLGYALWPDGFGCIGERCPSNDHSNGDRNRDIHGAFVGCAERVCWCHDPTSGDVVLPNDMCSGCGCRRAHHWHRSGAYAIRHRWL